VVHDPAVLLRLVCCDLSHGKDGPLLVVRLGLRCGGRGESQGGAARRRSADSSGCRRNGRHAEVVKDEEENVVRGEERSEGGDALGVPMKATTKMAM
jgi:hypothetical protein